MKCRYFSVLLFSAISLSAFAADGDWNQFRGPKRDGVSSEKGLLQSWPEKGPPLLWKAEGLGQGFSSVAVVGKQVFTMGDVKGSSYVFALNRADGKKLWEAKVGKEGGNYPGPRCTPCVDGTSVYALGQFGDLVCLNIKDGKEIWRKSLTADFKGSPGGWNYTESPLVDGEKLLITPGGKEVSVLALNKKTGAVIWKGLVPGGDTAGYSSIVAATIGGKKQYIQLMANGVVSFGADKGEFLWRFGNAGNRFGGNTANIPTPIVKDNFVFAAAGYGRGGALITVTESGGKWTAEEVWWSKELNNKHGGIILVGENLYGDRDDSGRPWAADFQTGKVKWSREDRSGGSGSASMTAADGKLYIRYNNGFVALAELGDSYKEISTFRVPNGNGNCWAHPVVAGGQLFLREKDILWCHDVKAK